MMRKITKRTLCSAAATAVMAFAGCTDELTDYLYDTGGAKEDTEAIRFGISTVEQADIIVETGRTRAAQGLTAPDSSNVGAATSQAFPLRGTVSGLYVHTMPLPLVEIHPGAASAPRRTEHSEHSEDSESSETSESLEHSPFTTRAPLSEIASTENFHDSLTIWGYINATTTDHADATLFNKVTLKKVRGWRSSVHWPYDGDEGGSRSMRFYAISPAISELEGMSGVNTPSFSSAPSFNYRVDKDVATHRDLLYGVSVTGLSDDASTTDVDETTDILIKKGPIQSGVYTHSDWKEKEQLGKDNKEVDLKFQHILTAIRFAQGNIPTTLRITKISLHGIKNQGSFYGNTKSWSALTGTANYDIDVAWKPKKYDGATYSESEDSELKEYIDGTNVYIDRGQVMFLLPQTLSGATLQVELDELDGGGNAIAGKHHTLSAKISGEGITTVWEQGYTYTYKITIGEVRGDYYLITTPPALFKHSPEAQNGTFGVHSYRAYKDYSTTEAGTDVTSHSINWKVAGVYSDEACTKDITGETTLNWLQDYAGKSGVQSGDASESLTITIDPQNEKSSKVDANHATILQANSQSTGDTGGGWDLSRMAVVGGGTAGAETSNYMYQSSNKRITANSYIVNNYGTYHFPLVYGNAINGNDETNVVDANTVCVDHEGSLIKQAWIHRQLNSSRYDTVGGVTKKGTSTGPTTEDGVTTTTTTSYKYTNFTAAVVWQDVSGLISTAPSVSKSDPSESDEPYISFGIAQGNIQPGNAVIALKGKKETTTTTKKESEEEGDQTSKAGTSGETTTECTYDSETNKTKIVATTVHKETGDDVVLWSWHIWVTDEVYPNAGSTQNKLVHITGNNDDKDIYIMPVNLGWVPDEMGFSHYKYRYLYLKIIQTDASGESIANSGSYSDSKNEQLSSKGLYSVIKVEQKALQPLITGTGTVYQWGRPNALPMIRKAKEGKTLSSNENRTIYGASGAKANGEGNYRIRISKDGDADAAKRANLIGTAIQNPDKAIQLWQGDSKQDEDLLTWWSYTNEERDFWCKAGTKKTLYDPCPPGFQIPNTTFYTRAHINNMRKYNDGTVLEDDNTSKAIDAKGPFGDPKGRGMYFYPWVESANNEPAENPKYYTSNDYFYMPATGNFTAGMNMDGESSGYLWTSNYGGDTNGGTRGYYIKIVTTTSQLKNDYMYVKELCDDKKDGNFTDERTKVKDDGTTETVKDNDFRYGRFSTAMQIRPVGRGRYDE